MCGIIQPMQTSTLVASLTVCVGVLAASAWYLLRDDPSSTATASKGPGDAAVADVKVAPKAEQHLLMSKPYPFDTFQSMIDALREVVPREGEPTWKDKENEYNIRIVDHKVSVQFEDASIQEVVDFLKTEYAKIGIVITDLDQPIPEGFKLTMFRAEADAYEVIAQIQDATQNFVVYAFSEYGVCIGTERTIQEWQIQSKMRRARENAEREHGAAFLDATFTVDLTGAHIGAVIQKMSADTGVDIIVEPRIWASPKRLDWTVEKPMKLRDGLSWLCKQFDAFYRVKDDRVFLIQP